MKGRDDSENLDVDGRIILNWILGQEGRCGLDSSGSGQRPVAGSREQGKVAPGLN
jgi:hypothetical protein